MFLRFFRNVHGCYFFSQIFFTTVTKGNSAQANHLRSIEEYCLVNLCWKHDSRLWDTLISTRFKITADPYRLPSIQHVLPKSEVTNNSNNNSSNNCFFAPDQDNSVMQSPATASMRFDSLRDNTKASSAASNLKSTARRQLFLRNKTEEMKSELKNGMKNQNTETEHSREDANSEFQNQIDTVAPAVALFLRKTYQLCIRKITLICDKLYEKLPHTKRKMRRVGFSCFLISPQSVSLFIFFVIFSLFEEPKRKATPTISHKNL